jgi:hypothetical protein
VTDGALLGIKPIRRDAEHIVALNADAVDDRAYDRARLHWLVQATRGRSDGLLRDAISRHGRILARRGLWSIGSGRHPGIQKTHPLEVRDAGSEDRVKREQGAG